MLRLPSAPYRCKFCGLNYGIYYCPAHAHPYNLVCDDCLPKSMNSICKCCGLLYIKFRVKQQKQ